MTPTAPARSKKAPVFFAQHVRCAQWLFGLRLRTPYKTAHPSRSRLFFSAPFFLFFLFSFARFLFFPLFVRAHFFYGTYREKAKIPTRRLDFRSTSDHGAPRFSAHSIFGRQLQVGGLFSVPIVKARRHKIN